MNCRAVGDLLCLEAAENCQVWMVPVYLSTKLSVVCADPQRPASLQSCRGAVMSCQCQYIHETMHNENVGRQVPYLNVVLR